MPKAPQILIDVATRHQVYLEGHKTHVAEKFGTFLQEMARSIDKRLRGKDLTAFRRDRAEALIAHVRDDLRDIYSDHFKVWREQIVDLAQYDSDFEVKSLKQVLDIDYKLPSRTQLRSAVFSKPLTGITGVDGGKLLPAFYRDWTSKTIERVQGVIRSGYYQGQTTPQIVRLIKGTAGAGFRDGQLARGNRDITMLTRTALQHAAGEAREETWRANSDIIKGVQIVSTLDDRTTDICQLMDGKIFPIDEGPRPPFHVGCRTTTVAAFDERYSFLDKDATRASRDPNDGRKIVPVDANKNYYEWLKGQSPDFQDSVIGPNRGKLLRDGGLSATRFKELSLDKNFKPLTLADMAKVEDLALAAERAGVNLN